MASTEITQQVKRAVGMLPPGAGATGASETG